MLSIINIKEENMNPEYDPERSRNGGGYYQPLITVDFSDGAQMVIEDTSCGDFGTRKDMALYDANHIRIAEAVYGSMIDVYEWCTSFHKEKHEAYLGLVLEATGYEVLTSEELADYIAYIEGEDD